jgi:hypothetical protein
MKKPPIINARLLERLGKLVRVHATVSPIPQSAAETLVEIVLRSALGEIGVEVRWTAGTFRGHLKDFESLRLPEAGKPLNPFQIGGLL